ncbi:hypothetical protein THAOC_17835 [Thalassiosira oceanica]|uniref:Uncharacterized protein n=1 Tax=Thalassiosira oceanica TaxID=159749 RepID=K0S8L4_THAOC|nr:hypothetical protein THAOC_17835 [Thalassiosira oceanica]|eukprot:EJK61640.1 hypothetical protein THAOC_17835 [Thalassiosira oceanica]
MRRPFSARPRHHAHRDEAHVRKASAAEPDGHHRNVGVGAQAAALRYQQRDQHDQVEDPVDEQPQRRHREAAPPRPRIAQVRAIRGRDRADEEHRGPERVLAHCFLSVGTDQKARHRESLHPPPTKRYEDPRRAAALVNQRLCYRKNRESAKRNRAPEFSLSAETEPKPPHTDSAGGPIKAHGEDQSDLDDDNSLPDLGTTLHSPRPPREVKPKRVGGQS